MLSASTLTSPAKDRNARQAAGLSRTVRAGFAHHQAGRLDRAEALYRKALEKDPHHADALHLLGVIAYQCGKIGPAIQLIERALPALADLPDAHLNHGNALRRAGRPAAAVESYRRAIALNPDYGMAHSNLARALNDQGLFEAGLESSRRAVELIPDFLGAHVNCAVALMGLERFAEAEVPLRRSLALRPNLTALHLDLGIALQKQHRLEEAEASYRRALALRPDDAEALSNLGNTLLELKRFGEALETYNRALAVRPDHAQALINRGNTLLELKRFDEALESYNQALAIRPDHVDAWLNCSWALKALNRWQEARAAFRAYLELNVPKSHKRRTSLVDLGERLFALDCIPAVYESESEIEAERTRIRQCIAGIEDAIAAALDGDNDEDFDAIIGAVLSVTGFYIGAQQKNDVAVMTSYSAILQKLLKPERLPLPALGRRSGGIRIGIASALLRNHNGTRWAYNWFCHLPLQDYEIFSYALDTVYDEVTAKFASLGHFRHLPFDAESYKDAITCMRQDQLDFLMLPDVGMTSASRILAQYRIAPVQFTAWGHPVTTGSPSIDFYLSSDLMEPEDAQNHYSERLIRLPNLALFLLPGAPNHDGETDAFGLPRGRILYGSVHALFTYLPQYDWIYPSIAKRVPQAFFVFVGGRAAHMTPVFQARLARAFAQQGLDATDYVQFVPRMSVRGFRSLLRSIDINIDSIGWSGGNTTIDSLEMGCPVVTLPTTFMRGRHAYAMLRMIDVNELIATSLDDFVDRLVRLGSDEEFRSGIVNKIEAHRSRLYEDYTFIAGLDKFFKSTYR